LILTDNPERKDSTAAKQSNPGTPEGSTKNGPSEAEFRRAIAK
jgi:hypothetical protein